MVCNITIRIYTQKSYKRRRVTPSVLGGSRRWWEHLCPLRVPALAVQQQFWSQFPLRTCDCCFYRQCSGHCSASLSSVRGINTAWVAGCRGPSGPVRKGVVSLVPEACREGKAESVWFICMVHRTFRAWSWGERGLINYQLSHVECLPYIMVLVALATLPAVRLCLLYNLPWDGCQQFSPDPLPLSGAVSHPPQDCTRSSGHPRAWGMEFTAYCLWITCLVYSIWSTELRWLTWIGK